MKRILCVCGLAACLALAMGQFAFAADGATIFKRFCAGCHGQSGENSAGGSDPIKGRSSADIQKMLLGYKDGSFGGKHKATMQNVVKKLSDDDVRAVADYIETLK